MSAELFRTATEGSRIPIASPNGFRRSASMRLRGERPNTLRIRGAGAAPVSTYGLQLHDQRQTVRAPALAAARAPPHNLTVPDQHGTQGRVRSYVSISTCLLWMNELWFVFVRKPLFNRCLFFFSHALLNCT